MTVSYYYHCFNCDKWSWGYGHARSPYPLWQFGMRCDHCGTQLISGQWYEVADGS
jgi:hypothetical protein